MEWTKSAGGPLICVESKLSDQWKGIDGLSTMPDSSTTGIATDYDRACKAKGYLSAIDMMKGAALILGDMPLETGVWKNVSNQLVIVRVFHIDANADVPSMLASIADDDRPLESINVSFGSRTLVIFDSALPGSEAKAESIRFDIAPGKYRVTTQLAKLARAELLLHRFYRDS